MRRTALTILAAATAAGVLAGCSDRTPGDPSSATTTGSKTGTTTSAAGQSSGDTAPPITGPELSLDRFKSDPCTLLSAEQIAKLGDMKPGDRRDSDGDPTCRWSPIAATGKVSFSFAISKSTLDEYYEGKDNYPVFMPTGVAGYPAANFDGTDAKHGACSTIIGLSKSTALLVQIHVQGKSTPNYATPCVESERGGAVAIEGLG